MLQGQLNGEEVVLLNTYGPNIDDTEFYPHLQELLGPAVDHPLIWLGDFYCIDNGLIDRYPPKTGTKPRMT